MASEMKGVQEAMDYLTTGGLGEVIGLTDAALKGGHPKVQSDTEMAMALCLLANEALAARETAAHDTEEATARQGEQE